MSSRPPIARIARISELLQSHKRFNHSTIAELLEVSTKTVQRDIDFMRDRLGYKMEYVAADHSWSGTVPERRVL